MLSGLSQAQLQQVGHPDQFRRRNRVHLLHHAGTVHLDRLFGDAELVGHLFVEQPSGHCGEHFPFAQSQGAVVLMHPDHMLGSGELSHVFLQRLRDRTEQLCVVEGFGQEILERRL